MKSCKRPCKACPWRVDAHIDDIPGFSLELAEGLANTSRDENGFGPDFFAPMMACHESTEANEIACAGWLAREGISHPQARMAIAAGDLTPDQFEPKEGWPEIHESFIEMIEKHREQAK